MKISKLFFFFLGLSTLIIAQDKSVGEYYKPVVEKFSANDTLAAKQLLDSLDAHTPDKYLNNVDYYFMRALLHLQIFESKKGDDTTDIYALKDAYQCLQKIQVLDSNEHYNKTVKELYSRLAGHFLYDGVNTFNHHRYKKALYEFEKVLTINNFPFIMRIDKMTYFNAAISAQKAGAIQKAIYYYTILTNWHFGGMETYYTLAELYDKDGKVEQAVKILEKGNALFPNDKYFPKTILTYYVKLKDYDNPLKYLKKIPQTDSTLFSTAAVFNEKNEQDSAIYYYKKCLQLNPEYNDANFNLGLLYYKNAFEQIKKINKVDKLAKTNLKQSAFYLEKSLSKNNADNLETLKILKSIFKLLKNKKKEAFYTDLLKKQ